MQDFETAFVKGLIAVLIYKEPADIMRFACLDIQIVNSGLQI